MGVGVGAGVGVGVTVGIDTGFLGKTSISFASATFKTLVCLLYSPTANILLPTKSVRSKESVTSKVIASDAVVTRKNFSVVEENCKVPINAVDFHISETGEGEELPQSH